jgi:hypothetical protein
VPVTPRYYQRMTDGPEAPLESADDGHRSDGAGAESQCIGDQGVDRGQIRAFLRLSPAERLRQMQRFVNAVLRIRQLNQIDERR